MAVSSAQSHALGQKVVGMVNKSDFSRSKEVRSKPSQIELAPGHEHVLVTGNFLLQTDSC